MKQKTNEVRDIEIEDLKNNVFELNEKLVTLTRVLLDTLGTKALRQKAIMFDIVDDFDDCDCGVCEDNFNVIAKEVTIKDILEDLRE